MPTTHTATELLIAYEKWLKTDWPKLGLVSESRKIDSFLSTLPAPTAPQGEWTDEEVIRFINWYEYWRTHRLVGKTGEQALPYYKSIMAKPVEDKPESPQEKILPEKEGEIKMKLECLGCPDAEKLIIQYSDSLYQARKQWYTGQHVGLPQNLKEINAQIQGFEDGLKFHSTISREVRVPGEEEIKEQFPWFGVDDLHRREGALWAIEEIKKLNKCAS